MSYTIISINPLEKPLYTIFGASRYGSVYNITRPINLNYLDVAEKILPNNRKGGGGQDDRQ